MSGYILDIDDLCVLCVRILTLADNSEDIKSAETVLATQSVAESVGGRLAAVARQIKAREVITGVSVEI
jgi:hypothetical protein